MGSGPAWCYATGVEMRQIRLYVGVNRQKWLGDKHMMRMGEPIRLSQENKKFE